jgi:hypothetical protein
MLDMMQQQNPGMNMGMLVKALSGVARVAGWYKSVKTTWKTNVWFRLTIFGLFMLMLARIFG